MRGDLLGRWGWLACALIAAGCGFTGPANNGPDDGGIEPDAPLPPAVVNFAADMSTEDEMSGPIEVEVTLSRPATSRITVPYRIVANSGTEWATAGIDFAGADGTITFEPGDSIKGIDLVIIGDAADEENEKIQIELDAPTGDAMLGSMTSHTVTINAFFLPRVGFMVATGTGGESTASVNLVLTMTSASTSPVTVGYTVTGDAELTSTGFGDHNLVAGSIIIPANQMMVSIPVTVSDDAYDEVDEHLVVTLTSSINAVIDQARTDHDYTITDNDAAPTVTFMTTTNAQDEDDANVTLTAQTSVRSEKDISVTFSQNTSVTNPAGATDFSYTTTGALTWGAGATTLTRTITVHVDEDTLDEFDEIVETVFGNAQNVTIPGGTKHTLTITDDDAAPTIGFTTADRTVDEGDADVTYDFVIDLSAASGKTVTATVAISGDAEAQDFSIPAGDLTLTFTPGQTSKTVRVTVVGDNVDEPGNPNLDNVTMTITSPVNATIATGAGARTLTITDDE